MLSRPPLYKNTKPYEVIIGKNLDNVKRYIRILKKYEYNHEAFEREIKKSFTLEQREIIGSIFKELRENGIYITGLKANGELEISYVVTENTRYQIDKSKNPKVLSKEENKRRLAEIRRRLKGMGQVDYSMETSTEIYESLEELEEAPF